MASAAMRCTRVKDKTSPPERNFFWHRPLRTHLGTPGETYKENGLLWANIHKIKICFNIHLDTWERKYLKYLYMTNKHMCTYTWGFPGSSAGKESAYEAGDPVSIPGLGRSAGEGIVHILVHACICMYTHVLLCTWHVSSYFIFICLKY